MIKAAAVFSNNMVLQRGRNVAVWGECDGTGRVAAEINGITASAEAAAGKWSLELPACFEISLLRKTLCSGIMSR